MPKTTAASDPVVGRLVTSGGETYSSSSIGGGRRTPRLETGVRAAQQAFAGFELDFVVVRSLPERPERTGRPSPEE